MSGFPFWIASIALFVILGGMIYVILSDSQP